MEKEKKNGVVVKDDHNEFELMLRFFGNEILAIKLAASNFNGKLIMWSIVIMLFTFMLPEIAAVLSNAEQQSAMLSIAQYF